MFGEFSLFAEGEALQEFSRTSIGTHALFRVARVVHHSPRCLVEELIPGRTVGITPENLNNPNRLPDCRWASCCVTHRCPRLNSRQLRTSIIFMTVFATEKATKAVLEAYHGAVYLIYYYFSPNTPNSFCKQVFLAFVREGLVHRCWLIVELSLLIIWMLHPRSDIHLGNSIRTTLLDGRFGFEIDLRQPHQH